MNWEWASSLDHIWRSPSFPMWATLAAAAFFAVLLLITLIRAEKSVANGALTVITLLAVGVAVAATVRGFGWPGSPPSADNPAQPAAMATLPAMSCIDDLAGETVLTACERALFASPDSVAAAVAYAGSRISRLTSFGDAATANRNMTTELESLRRSVERDRYGLMAYVLVARDHCTPQACPAFRSLGNNRQIVTNMDDRVYEGLVIRHSASWGAPPPGPPIAAGIPSGALAAIPPSSLVAPSGKPSTMIDFPSASSTPPVNIMTPEPGGPGSAAPLPRAPVPAAGAPPRPAPAATPAAPKKQAPPKSARAPTQLAPPPGSPPQAPASAADND